MATRKWSRGKSKTQKTEKRNYRDRDERDNDRGGERDDRDGRNDDRNDDRGRSRNHGRGWKGRSNDDDRVRLTGLWESQKKRGMFFGTVQDVEALKDLCEKALDSRGMTVGIALFENDRGGKNGEFTVYASLREERNGGGGRGRGSNRSYGRGNRDNDIRDNDSDRDNEF